MTSSLCSGRNDLSVFAKPIAESPSLSSPVMIDYTLPLDQMPDPLPIEPLRAPFDVTITPPGSKSITNRAYILAALAKGESRISRPLRSDDCDLLLDALCTLGAQACWAPGGDDVFITGVNGHFPRGGIVNLGDGGTPTRFMIAAACLAAQPVIVDGSKRMRERPIAEGVDMLRQLGAHIEYVEEEGRLPVRTTPSDDFKGGEITVGKTASSQFISAIMLIAPWLPRGAKIRHSHTPTSQSYIDLTHQVMILFGIKRLTRPKVIKAHDIEMHADASSAVYWSAATKLSGPSTMSILGIHQHWSEQPDLAALWILDRFAGRSDTHPSESGVVVVGSKKIESQNVSCDRCPDGALAVAMVAAAAHGTSTITGLHTLRVKETDRIAALAAELTRCGCTVEATDDSITITPHERDSEGNIARHDPVTIETYNDHRMAMAFAILGLVRPGISIANPACVSKSYPTFWVDFAKLYHNQPNLSE